MFSLQRWYWDGSVQCFHGDHLPLGLLAIFILMFAVSLIIVMILSNFYLKFKVCTIMMSCSFLSLIFCLLVSIRAIHVVQVLRVAGIPGCLYGLRIIVSSGQVWSWDVNVLIMLIFIIAFGRNEVRNLSQV